MIEIYGLKNCDRCRAALKWLKAQQCDARLYDVRAEGLPPDAAKRWIAALGTERIVNRRSATWRTLPPARRTAEITPEHALALLADYPALLKRPVMEIGDRVFIGFDSAIKTELAKALEVGA